MMRYWAWIIGLVVILVLTFTGYKLYQLGWKKETVVIGLSEQARKDHYLALNHFLIPHGKTLTVLEDHQSFYDGDRISVETKNTSLVIDESWFYKDKDFMNAVLEWVNHGGQLMYLLSSRRKDTDTNTLLNEVTPAIVASSKKYSPSHDITDKAPDRNAYIASFEGLVGDQYPMVSMLIDDGAAFYLAYQYSFAQCYPYEWQVQNEYSDTLACHVPVGSGSITALSSLHFLNNYGLKHYDNAALSLALFDSSDEIIYLKDNHSFYWFELLIGEYWELSLLISMIFIILFWNLYSRFGPALTIQSEVSSNYLDHIQMLGQFYRENGYTKIMSQALKAEEFNNTTIRSDAKTNPDEPKLWIEHVREIQKLRNKQ